MQLTTPIARNTVHHTQDTPEICHCPCTGKIGGLRYKEMSGLNLPCLLSAGTTATRKTRFTGMHLLPSGTGRGSVEAHPG